MVEELDHLIVHTVEPTVFFNLYFLAPIMPRFKNQEVHLAVISNNNEYRSYLRLLVSY